MNNARIEFLWRVHEYINRNTHFADGKAGISFAATSGLISWITAHYDKFSDAERFGFFPTLLIWSGVACLMLAVTAFAAVLIPRLWAKSQKGLIFWEQVAKYDTGAAYSHAVTQMNEEGIEVVLADHIHIMARLASRKYALVAFGVNAAAAGVLCVAWPGLKILLA